MGVFDSLAKQSNVSDVEMGQDEKAYTESGVKIVEEYRFLKKRLKVSYYHQEHYDGSGYPRGPKGNDPAGWPG